MLMHHKNATKEIMVDIDELRDFYLRKRYEIPVAMVFRNFLISLAINDNILKLINKTEVR